MKKLHLFAVLGVVAALALATTQALANVEAAGVGLPQAAGGTHGPPATMTVGPGTPTPTEDHPGGGPPMTPGAKATEQAGQQGLQGQGGQHGPPQILRGTITGLTPMTDPTSMMLKLDDGTPATIGLTADTKIHVPGPKSEGDHLLVDMHVIVMAFADQGNNLVARAVLVIPGQPVRVHRVGTVTAYTAGVIISIKATDGNTYTFNLTPNTQILPPNSPLAVNDLVTIIAPRDPSTLVWTATGIVVHLSQ